MSLFLQIIFLKIFIFIHKPIKALYIKNIKKLTCIIVLYVLVYSNTLKGEI